MCLCKCWRDLRSKAHSLNINLSKLVNNLWNLNINLPADGLTTFDARFALICVDVNSFWFFFSVFVHIMPLIAIARVRGSDYCRKLRLEWRQQQQHAKQKRKTFIKVGRGKRSRVNSFGTRLTNLRCVDFASDFVAARYFFVSRSQKSLSGAVISAYSNSSRYGGGWKFKIRLAQNYNCKVRRNIMKHRSDSLARGMTFWCSNEMLADSIQGRNEKLPGK